MKTHFMGSYRGYLGPSGVYRDVLYGLGSVGNLSKRTSIPKHYNEERTIIIR